MKFTTLSRVLTFSCALSVSAVAEDWTQFRGPTGQGHSSAKNLPIEWNHQTGKNIAWKVPIPGHGWSSPLLVKGKIYLTTAVPAKAGSTYTDRSLRVLCLSALSGETLWDNEVFHQAAADSKIHSKNSHATPTPIIEDGKLYAHFGHKGTACLNLDGKIVWRNRELKYPPLHGGGGSPVIYQNLLIFSCDGTWDPFVVALNKRSGKIAWKTPRKVTVNRKFSFTTPLLVKFNGRTELVSPGSGAVCSYNPKNGKEIWRVRYGQGYSVVPRPVAGHGMVFVGTGYDAPDIKAIKLGGEGDITSSHIAWESIKRAPLNPSKLLIGDELYFVSDGGTASCADARSGKVHWYKRVGARTSASPVYADGRIYFQDEYGKGTVVAAGKEFKELAKNEVEGRTFANYALEDGVIFIRSEKWLYRIEEKP